MIKFKRPELEWEFDNQLHPAARGLILELDRFCSRAGYGDLVLTEVWRSEAVMTRYYGEGWEDSKWSWHLVGRAVDIRNKNWTTAQRHAIELWLKKNWPDGEILMHDIGRGDHLHVAIPGPYSRLRRLKRWAMRRKNAA